MISTFEDFYSDSPEVQERARGFNNLYLTTPGNTNISDFFSDVKRNENLAQLLKAALDIRVHLKELNYSVKEINSGKFFNDTSKFTSPPKFIDFLLYAAHCSKIISLNPNEPFMEFKRNDSVHDYIGLRWVRGTVTVTQEQDGKLSVSGMLNAFDANSLAVVLRNNDRQSKILTLEEFFNQNLCRYSLNVNFWDGYCTLSYDSFIEKCVSCLILGDNGNSTSILTLLQSLFPGVVPDVIYKYIQLTMFPPKKEYVDAEKGKFDMVYHTLGLDYENVNKSLPLYNTGVLNVLKEIFGVNSPTQGDLLRGGKLCGKLEQMAYASNFPKEKPIYYI